MNKDIFRDLQTIIHKDGPVETDPEKRRFVSPQQKRKEEQVYTIKVNLNTDGNSEGLRREGLSE